jgi:carbonic anhydrase
MRRWCSGFRTSSPHIIVLGHSHCGGVAAYRDSLKGRADDSSFIGRWLTLLDGIKITQGDAALFGKEIAFELAGVRQSLANLRSFPVIREREQEGLVALHGLHFDIGSGMLIALDENTDGFAALADEA